LILVCWRFIDLCVFKRERKTGDGGILLHASQSELRGPTYIEFALESPADAMSQEDVPPAFAFPYVSMFRLCPLATFSLGFLAPGALLRFRVETVLMFDIDATIDGIGDQYRYRLLAIALLSRLCVIVFFPTDDLPPSIARLDDHPPLRSRSRPEERV
jgi:hypothetical protein